MFGSLGLLSLSVFGQAPASALAIKLEGESGEQFDKDFLSANSSDHHKVVSSFQKESQSGSDPEIKAFAIQFLPAIQEHSQTIDQALTAKK